MSELDLLTPAEVARMFRVDPKTVTRWGKAGQLRCVKTPGGHRRFYADDVIALISESTVEQDPAAFAPIPTRCFRCGQTGGIVRDRGTSYGRQRYMHSLESCPGSSVNGGTG